MNDPVKSTDELKFRDKMEFLQKVPVETTSRNRARIGFISFSSKSRKTWWIQRWNCEKKKTSIYPISQQVCMWINIQKKGYACDSQHQMIILWVNLESWMLIKLREMQRAFASISSSYAHSSTKVVNSNMDTIIMKLVLSWHRLCEFYFFTPLFKTFCLCLTGHYTKNHLLPALYRKLRKNISLKPANHYGCFHQIMQLLMVASTLV